jgi:hypothetical protein
VTPVVPEQTIEEIPTPEYVPEEVPAEVPGRG